tara:strand:+ start:584 stop:889 length:306 start_codon:yes stop_codon:yes gene_type:complete
LKFHKQAWKDLTSDRIILDAISGYKIEFIPGVFPPRQNKPVFPHKFTDDEVAVIDAGICKLREKNVIEISHFEKDQYVSPIFTRPKKRRRFSYDFRSFTIK